ncbi:L-threonylcarbamoyladenylate synthase [Arcanobacterium phocae]|uniref:L-threonylcarbamoyladenylate synthase n=1 Tax=Arcanobacterium phocae TaxID=131112 RepID=A0A1H2LA56_9ACTO|nr:L-threonylcarbamoyladenylate synthase [Arcanobacterium phocae]SDU77605.1 tRNA threonylcarbamoyl adenosine modification protein, Sua5/YciO/YrdC/YwlC family [Arcanobacterium phocae]
MVVVSSEKLGYALDTAQQAIQAGQVVCLPTDTVYGIGADPFSYDAVTALLTAKSRTRAMPPPVLVSSVEQAQTLVAQLPDSARAVMAEFWPGALTVILPAREELGWDLGETFGTVAVRMPDDAVTLEFLRRVGPLAVTSANKTGQKPATDISRAVEQLSDAVAVYIDGGTSPGGVPSTIIRWNSADDSYEVLRQGALSREDLTRVIKLQESA